MNLDQAVRRIETLRSCPTFLQVGAMDGVAFDPLFPLVEPHWRGLLVEPIGHHFRSLVHLRSRPGLMFERVAIAGHDGHIDMTTVAQSAPLQPWCQGLSSLTPERNALARPEVAAHAKVERVECLTLRSLLDRWRDAFGDGGVHMLQVDAEGFDAEIVMQGDVFAQVFDDMPLAVNLETCLLPPDVLLRVTLWLERRGYVLFPDPNGEDTLAVLPEVLR